MARRKFVNGLIANKQQKQQKPNWVSEETYIEIMCRFGENGFTLDEFITEAKELIPTKKQGVYQRLIQLCRFEHGNWQKGIPSRYFWCGGTVEEWNERQRQLKIEQKESSRQWGHIYDAIRILETASHKAGSICWDDIALAYAHMTDCCRQSSGS
jgi:hypothetical protein